MKERNSSELTLKDHLEMADKLHTAREAMQSLYTQMLKHYVIKDVERFSQIIPSRTQSKFSQLQSELDNSYHDIITEEEYLKHGNIYYKHSRIAVLEGRGQ